MVITVEQEGTNELLVYFHYDPELIAKIKTFSGRKWDQECKKWRIPYSEQNLAQIFKVFGEQNVLIKKLGKKNDLHINKNQEISCCLQQTLKALDQQLKLKGYSTKTRKSYIAHVRRFEQALEVSLEELTEKDIKDYLYDLLENEEKSHSYVNQAVSAIKFLYSEIYHKAGLIIHIPRPKKEKKLPKVLSEEEVFQILESVENKKHRAILFLTYAAGLRVGEVVSLQIQDIDSKRMLIHIRQGKGRKDRVVMLSEVALQELRVYFKKYRPEKWLFPGGKEEWHITERTVQKIFANACKKAKIQK